MKQNSSSIVKLPPSKLPFVLAYIITILALFAASLFYFGIHTLLLAPFYSILGILVFNRIYPPFSSTNQQDRFNHNPIDDKVNNLLTNNSPSMFINGIINLLSISPFQQALLNSEFHLEEASVNLSTSSAKLYKALAKNSLIHSNPSLLNYILNSKEIYVSTGKIAQNFKGNIAIDNNNILCEVSPLVDGHSGDLYYLFSIDRDHHHNSMKLHMQSPEVLKFLSGLAHDLNNLFAGLEGSLNLLKKQTMSSLSPRHLKLLSNLSKIAESGKKLSQDLLGFGHAINSHSEKNSVNLLQSINQIVTLLEAQQKSQSVQLKLSIPNNLWVYASSGGLHQVLINLIFNAYDSINDNGEIKISAWSDADQVIIQLSDTGCGMSEAVLNRIFEPFYTTKKMSQNKNYIGGSGLGLSNVKSLVDSWRGQIHCKSIENIGTTFEIRLARAPEINVPQDSGSLVI